MGLLTQYLPPEGQIAAAPDRTVTDKLRDYWQSIPASGAVNNVVNHVKALGGMISPSSTPEKRKQSAKDWANSVVDNLAGMGPSDIGGGLMGFTRNGVPNNHPEFVHAFRKQLHEAAQANGKQLRTKVQEYPWATNMDLELLDAAGNVHVLGSREFKPEGVQNVFLQTMQKDKPSGLLSWLYPAEQQIMNKYGGELWGDFVNPKTHKGFFESNPNAAYNEQHGRLRADYPGLEDFTLNY